MGRFVVNENFHEAVKGLEWEGEALKRLRQTPDGLRVLKLLTSQMYSFWTRANGTPVLGILRNWVDENCAAAASPGAAEPHREITGRRKLLSGPLDRLREAVNSREVAKWGNQDNRITSDFWVVEQRDDGAVLVSTSESGLVCLALGIADSITKVLPPTSFETPVCVSLTLIPFQRRLVYDGVVSTRAAGTASPADLRARVLAAERTGALVRSIPLPQPETQEERQRIQTGLKSVAGAQLSAQDQQIVDTLASLSSLPIPASPAAPQTGMWVMRRMDYTEAGNPNHMGVIMSGAGMMLGPFFSASLEPTAGELFAALVQTAVRLGKKPACVMIDAEAAVPHVRQVLQDHARIQVAYYPPPSKEEQASILGF